MPTVFGAFCAGRHKFLPLCLSVPGEGGEGGCEREREVWLVFLRCWRVCGLWFWVNPVICVVQSAFVEGEN